MRYSILFILALIAGCGGDDAVACDFTITQESVTVHSCAELEGSEDPDAEEANCKDRDNVKAKLVDSCSTADVLGICTLSQGDSTLTQYYYRTEGLTPEIAKQICEQVQGSWQAK
jgi:hypothetical protein